MKIGTEERSGTWASGRVASRMLAMVLVALVATASGCGTSTGGEIEIAGSYNDGFADHTIGGVRWTMSGMDFTAGFTIMRVNNDEDWAVAQNDADNAFNAGQWSRFEWTRVGSTLYFCQSTYDAGDEAAAVASTRPDRSNPAMSGCGTFPWSVLTSTAR